MSDSGLHEDAVVVDGLILADFGLEVFEDMRRGGVTAANCACSAWEGFQATMDNIALWNQRFRDFDDVILRVRQTDDILRAKKERKAGVILGLLNVSAFEDKLGYIQILKDAGVGIAQLTHYTQNLAGAGCYETNDGGLSDFGREVVAEMNRIGIMCDLSHSGAKTSEDAIRASRKAVCYSHCLPAVLKRHPRNKTDGQLKFLADNGGLIGVTMFTPFLKKGVRSTIDDYVEAIEYVINVAGEDAVGIGSDFTQGRDQAFFDYIAHDKGYGRKLTDFGEIANPEGFRTIGEFPNLTAAMERTGWSERRIRKVLGENWVRVLGDAWGG